MPVSAPGASVVTVSPEQQLDLADILFDEAEYSAAITEYRRFVNLFPDHSRFDYAVFQVARACLVTGDVEKALPIFERLRRSAVDRRYAVEAFFMVGRCRLLLGNPGPAVSVLKELIASVDDIDIKDRAYYHIGWICLEAEPVLSMTAVQRAGEYFSKISDKNQGIYRVGVLTGRLHDVSLDKNGPLCSVKNPVLAGTLAVLPGAGYVYCGRYHDALMSFLFNTGLAVAAWEAFDSDLEALGALIGFVGTGFYAGSIYGSVSASHKYNRANSKQFLDRLDDIRIDFLPLSTGRGAAVSIHVPF